MKKAGILSAAATLAASVVFVGAAAVANAAPVAVTTDLVYVAPGEAANVTIDGCSVGATLTVLVEGEEVVSWEVADGDLPATEAFSHDEIGPGQLTITAECAPADEEAPSSSDVTLTFFGSAWLEADPEEFNTGDPVTITAGDFLPGEAVALDVYPAGSDDSVFTHALGTAGEDFSVTGVVVFPADLECGEYVVELTSEAGAVAAELYICGAPDPTPTPTPSETVSPTPSPSVTTSPTAAPTTPSPQPGLPSTGR